jgi:hypothetical protein
MSANNIPIRPYFNPWPGIIAGELVKRIDWVVTANNLNWSLGSHDIPIPYHLTKFTLAGTTGGNELFYKYTPNGRHVMNYWSSAINTVSTTNTAEYLSAKISIATSTTAPTQFGINTNTLGIYSKFLLSSVNIRRNVLDQSTEDYGVDVDSYNLIDASSYRSLGGLFPAAAQPFRKYYLAKALPAVKASCYSNATTTYTYLIKNGVILTRKVYVNDLTGRVIWYFYCSASSASYGGTIKITNVNNGRSYEKVIAGSAPLAAGFVWHSCSTTDYDLKFDCEDLTTTSGMPADTFTEFHIEFKSANAAGIFYVASMCAEEQI